MALFGYSERPIHYDWRTRPPREKKEGWWIPPKIRKQMEADRRRFAETHVCIGQDEIGCGIWKKKSEVDQSTKLGNSRRRSS